LQDRLQGSLRGYVPLSGSLTLVLGGDARVLVTDDPDPSDLYRLGGASSLRGYDEERFAGIAVGRALVEVRSRLQGPSFAYLFADVGYVDPGRGPDEKPGVHPGFGVGVRLMTAAGLLNVSYAVNREDGLTNGRVHFGIAFGL
ncbi:MAG: BamA/TamA family outer membrane protein, partial [Rhodothermales bacterium]|nr:BamA/TamA family outer membrane protein [Rhodothermales bacterium]